MPRHTQKANGIHYTPPSLAAYLARNMTTALLEHGNPSHTITVLDPACGEGELLSAVAKAVHGNARLRLALTGFDMDETALARAKETLSQAGVTSVRLYCADFLSAISGCPFTSQMNLDFDSGDAFRFGLEHPFDAVISNPPYVRTQVLGAEAARKLATRFNLTGRVDLYHAFVKAMTFALRSGGILGLLTSNRFLTVQSGVSMREWLLEHFRLLRLVDLGDTKLFEAAVLPAILIGQRTANGSSQDCEFVRVYEQKPDQNGGSREFISILEALNGSFAGNACVNNVCYRVETGRLLVSSNNREPWSMTNHGIKTWLATIRENSAGTFSDFGKVCVGIKTTADAVFIRDDWTTLPEEERPEEELLHPLVTHHVASRWRINSNMTGMKRVLYPYAMPGDSRLPVDLSKYPHAGAYLRKHRQRLEGRSYVIEAGRQWYEIWVPHHPKDWMLPKLAFPDISETSNFFLTENGWVVNGDCYWIKLLPGKEIHWLWLMLAVANSKFVLQFYDAVFHNKLYSGRRRFMSQYVNLFPLPQLKSSNQILGLMPSVLEAASRKDTVELEKLQEQLDDFVWKAFGLNKKVAR